MKYAKLKVEEIDDRNVDKAGEEDLKRARKVKLVSDDVVITISGTPDTVTGFVTGDITEMQVKKSQTTLVEEEEEI